jgi:hypothetical protein
LFLSFHIKIIYYREFPHMSSIDDAGLIHDQEDIAGGNSLSTDKQTSTGDATLRNLIHIKEVCIYCKI